jgi:ABC-type dipeptide/oligopeptide/nickel transport system permease component
VARLAGRSLLLVSIMLALTFMVIAAVSIMPGDPARIAAGLR